MVQILLNNFKTYLNIDLLKDNTEHQSFTTELSNFQNNLGLFMKDKELFFEKNEYGMQSVLNSIKYCFHNFSKINFQLEKIRKFREFMLDKNLVKFRNEKAISDLIENFTNGFDIYMNRKESETEEANEIRRIFSVQDSSEARIMAVNSMNSNDKKCIAF